MVIPRTVSGVARWTGWNGTTQGVKVVTVVSNPALRTSPAEWSRFAQVNNGSQDLIDAGFEKITKGMGGFCTGGGGLFAFAWFNAAGSGAPRCIPVNSDNINQNATIEINPYYSNGGGMLVNIYMYDGQKLTYYIDNGWGLGQSFGQIKYQEQIFDYVTGHEVWGSAWEESSYMENNTWYYQHRGADFLTYQLPPQMYWYIEPANGNAGGELHTCVYDSNVNDCVLGATPVR